MKLITKLSLIISILLSVTSCKKETKKGSEKELEEEKYIITGEVTGFSDGAKFYLRDMSIRKKLDSAVVKNNKFKFEGKLAETPNANISIDIWVGYKDSYKDYSHILFMGNEIIEIKGDIKDLSG